jgi:hypothetical protein
LALFEVIGAQLEQTGVFRKNKMRLTIL